MSLRTLSRLVSLLALAAPLTLGAVACGPKDEVKHANVKAGSMPEGQDWQGVYYSPLYGYLHIMADGSSVNGGWRTAAGDAYGEMAGTIEGNLLKYEWKERRIGAVGADAIKKGKGYFLYTVPVAGEAAQIKGEWGLGESDAGNTWEAVKQKNMPPDLKAVQPDEFEGRVSGGGWDEGEGGESKEGDGEKKDGDSSEEK
jgi:hypothetical protein